MHAELPGGETRQKERNVMLTAEAHVQTERASRYLAQLCRHAGQMRRLHHRPRAHGGQSHAAPPEILGVDLNETHGTVRMNFGQWSVHATGDTLTLLAEAATEENLRRIQDLLGGRLEKIGRRDQLTVNWQPTETPVVQPAQADGTTASPADADMAAGTGREFRHKAGLIALAVLAVGVHLGLFGAVLASSRWSWTADVVLAIVVLELVAITIGGRSAILRRHQRKG